MNFKGTHILVIIFISLQKKKNIELNILFFLHIQDISNYRLSN